MTARSAFRLGQAIGSLVALAIVIVAFAWGDFLRLTADEQNRDAVVWIYDRDAAPGQTIAGRAWIEAGEVTSVEVARWLHRNDPDRMKVELLGETFGERPLGSSLDFTFHVPDDAAPGDTLDLSIEIRREGRDIPDLTHSLTLISPGASVLRRIGKGGLAILLLGGLAALAFALKRRALRRSTEESPLWVVPAVVIGGMTFVPLVEQATRLHGWWFYGLALAAWAVAGFAIGERLNRRLGLTAYSAVPMLVDMEAHQAFRDAKVETPIRPIDDLENAWSAVGLVVRRAGRDLIVTGPGKRFAIVPVPRSETVGSEPLVLRTNDADFVDLLVASASDVLGELRVQ